MSTISCITSTTTLLPPDREAQALTIAAYRRPRRVANAGRRSQGGLEGGLPAYCRQTADEITASYWAAPPSGLSGYCCAIATRPGRHEHTLSLLTAVRNSSAQAKAKENRRGACTHAAVRQQVSWLPCWTCATLLILPSSTSHSQQSFSFTSPLACGSPHPVVTLHCVLPLPPAMAMVVCT